MSIMQHEKARPHGAQDGSPQDIETQGKDLPVDELMKRLESSPEGLSGTEAAHRLEQYGYNELAEYKESALRKFLSYFWGPIPIMIIIAAALSGALQHWPDLGVILALLFINAIVGFREEQEAGNAIEALKRSLALQARVRRDGEWRTIPAQELVPGDVIRLRLGEIIPADARLLDGEPVQVDQSALTGESLPVEHKAGDVVYSGSILRQGETEALVYATGPGTYYGRTAELVQSAQTRSHLQRAILKIADFLLVTAIGLAVLIVAVAVFRGEGFLTVLQFALVLTIAAVPVAMPAVLSVTMALGARALARQQAIVTKLSAVEEVAGIDVLCSDKTGTLTQNKLTPGTPSTLNGVKPADVILAGALASRAEDRDPIDLAVLSGIKDKEQLKSYQVTHFQPFDPVHKRTEATVRGEDGSSFKTTKGAPQVILALDPDASTIKPQVDQAVNEFAARGFRSLGVARADDNGPWHFLGVIPLFDPLREDSKETVDTAKAMGLEIKMVTGDQMAIAKEIARQLDLGQNIIDATAFGEVRHHEESQLDEAIEQADGFAQVFPEHKYHIVDVLQKHDHIVGMTGDGVNDAPALKKADAGVAVSGATDAARAAASIVLLLPGLSPIIDAIKESRKIFQRMNNYAIYRISETVALLGFLTLTILMFQFYPVTAIMIVLIAIFNDGSIISIAYDNTRPAERPQRWNMTMVLGVSIFLGGYAVLRSFGIFYIGDHFLNLMNDPDTLRTLVYLNLAVGGIFTLYVARTRQHFWSIVPSRVLLVATLSAQIIATFIAVYGFLMAPLGWTLAGFVWGYCFVLFLIQDWVKLLAYRLFGPGHSGWFGARHTQGEEEEGGRGGSRR
ncbi:MAG: plasma-membrane proton-efflux P-type ATPase [Chloroflexota bacterium]